MVHAFFSMWETSELNWYTASSSGRAWFWQIVVTKIFLVPLPAPDVLNFSSSRLTEAPSLTTETTLTFA